MSNTNSNSVTGDAFVIDSHQNISDVSHLFIELNHNRCSPILVRHRPDIFHLQRVDAPGFVLRVRGNCVHSFARSEAQISHNKHDSRAVVGCKWNGGERREGFAFISYGLDHEPPGRIGVTEQDGAVGLCRSCV